MSWLSCHQLLFHPFSADLVPVSSTVIPLTVLEVSYGAGGKPSEEYKAAYLRKLRKQVLQRTEKGEGVGEDSEDVLITGGFPPVMHSILH